MTLKTLLISAILSGSFLVCSNRADAAVWTPTQTWSEAYEARYAEWLEKNFDENFFFKGKWGGMKTDCADAVYGSRIIFAYLNSLPFMLSTTDMKFNHQTTAFDHIADPIARVRAFVEFVNDRTWTGSLARHTYPVAITRATIRPGVIWMKPGHVETVLHVRSTGVVDLRGSWLPGAIRKMITITTLGYVPRKNTLGFRRWIWPQNLGLDLKSQPGYDDTQFAFAPRTPAPVNALDLHREVASFEEAVRQALQKMPGQTAEKPAAKVRRLAKDFCALIESRSEVVQSGYDYSMKLKRCLNKTEYHAYSTPSRDSSLRRVVIGLGLELGNDFARINQALRSCPPIAISKKISVRADDFFRRLLTLEFSSNPHERPEVRFGIEPEDEVCVGDGTDAE